MQQRRWPLRMAIDMHADSTRKPAEDTAAHALLLKTNGGYDRKSPAKASRV